MAGKYKLFQITNQNDDSKITWNCGESLRIEGLTMRFLTNSGKECGDTGHMQCIGVPNIEPVSTPILATATSNNLKCFEDGSGSITITASGGVQPYKFSINGNVDSEYQSSNVFNGVPASPNPYNKIYVRDAKGKIFLLNQITISQPSL